MGQSRIDQREVDDLVEGSADFARGLEKEEGNGVLPLEIGFIYIEETFNLLGDSSAESLISVAVQGIPVHPRTTFPENLLALYPQLRIDVLGAQSQEGFPTGPVEHDPSQGA
jgi:hypothetical protein